MSLRTKKIYPQVNHRTHNEVQPTVRPQYIPSTFQNMMIITSYDCHPHRRPPFPSVSIRALTSTMTIMMTGALLPRVDVHRQRRRCCCSTVANHKLYYSEPRLPWWYGGLTLSRARWSSNTGAGGFLIKVANRLGI